MQTIPCRHAKCIAFLRLFFSTAAPIWHIRPNLRLKAGQIGEGSGGRAGRSRSDCGRRRLPTNRPRLPKIDAFAPVAKPAAKEAAEPVPVTPRGQ